MCKLILTVDYEIWGNGTRSFSELVYEPTQKTNEALISDRTRRHLNC